MVNSILNVNTTLAYILVGGFVFAEDALFFGFVLPGETAAVLGGVVASQGHVQLWLMIFVVVFSAVAGDTVGYEIGKHFGIRLLNAKIFAKRRTQLDRAQLFLRDRGGMAVFFGRFVAFFRAVMPALAGAARMRYPRFFRFNAAGGIVWGTAFVTLGFFAGKSYATIAQTVGRDSAIIIGAIVVGAILIWRIRKHRQSRNRNLRSDSDPSRGADPCRGADQAPD